DLEPELRRQLAVLAVLESEPAELRRGARHAAELVDLVAREAGGAAARASGPPPDEPKRGPARRPDGGPDRIVAERAALGALGATGDPRGEAPGRDASERAPATDRPSRPATPRGPAARPDDPAVPRSSEPGDEADPALLDPRAAAA